MGPLVTDAETKRIASAVAKEVLQEFFLTIGIDATSPSAIIDLQKDFHHIRAARQTVGQVRSKAWDVLTGSAVTGLLGAIAFYFSHGMK